MTGTSSNVISLWPDDAIVLTTELDPASTAEHAVLHVTGDLDMATAPTLLNALTGLAERGCRHVDVHMRQVRFCDGSGLAVLLEGRRRIGENDGGITLHNPCRSLQRILDICDLTPNLQARTRAGTRAPDGSSGDGPGDGSGGGSAGSHLRLLPPLGGDT